jgi:hypothetical protein
MAQLKPFLLFKLALGLMVLCLPVLNHASSEEETPLSPAFKKLIHPIDGDDRHWSWNPIDLLPSKEALRSSPFNEMIPFITPIRNQGERGTCSIFSSIAWWEVKLAQAGSPVEELDLSEEWLAHLVARQTLEDGSETTLNFQLINDHGLAQESTLRYIPQDWQEKTYHQKARVIRRCGHLRGILKKACLIGHWDPALLSLDEISLRAEGIQLARARADAIEWKTQHRVTSGKPEILTRVRDIKKLLSEGVPLVLDLDFFYGAWNHFAAEDLNIGRDHEAFLRGEVGYPRLGSIDEKRSLKNPIGHSVLVVGYDDDEIIETTVRHADGSEEVFRYRGVYYFKNSWGKSSFGKNFEAQGIRAPGFGKITQKYAHERGQFFRSRLRNDHPQVLPIR